MSLRDDLASVTDKVRVLVGGALSSKRGDQYKPVKLIREVLGTANDLAGRPFCSEEELLRRHERQRGRTVGRFQAQEGAKKEAAPVMVYFDGQDHRTLKKVEELLRSRDIPFKTLDVTDDESTRSWATTQAHALEFPLIFIAGESVGGWHELTSLDVNGILKKRVYGS